MVTMTGRGFCTGTAATGIRGGEGGAGDLPEKKASARFAKPHVSARAALRDPAVISLTTHNARLRLCS